MPGAHADLVSAEGMVYFMFDDGTTSLIRPDEGLDIVVDNSVSKVVFANPATSQGQMFIKSDRHLFFAFVNDIWRDNCCVYCGQTPQLRLFILKIRRNVVS